MKRTALATALLALTCSAAACIGQTQSGLGSAQSHSEEMLGQLEEIAMCHHAIKAARHFAVAFNENAYYQYLVNSPQKGHDQYIFPIPQRCTALETSWVLDYTTASAGVKAAEDEIMHDTVEMTISDISSDAQFLTVVINKMEREGEGAVFLENEDKDVPR